MGIASLVGRIAKVFKGGGRLAKNIHTQCVFPYYKAQPDNISHT